jgi:hypothetical protein
MSQYFNRMAARSGLSSVTRPNAGLVADKKPVPQQLINPAVENSASGIDIEVQEEREAVSSSLQQQSPAHQSSPASQSPVKSTLPDREPAMPESFVQVSASEPLVTPLTVENLAGRSRGEQVSEIRTEVAVTEPSEIRDDQLARVEKSGTDDSDSPALMTPSTQTDQKTGVADTSVKEITLERDATSSSAFPTSTVQVDNVEPSTIVEQLDVLGQLSESKVILEQDGRRQLTAKGEKTSPAAFETSTVSVKQENPALSQIGQNSFSPTSLSVVNQALPQALVDKAPSSEKSGIEIKIGRIDLEVHQPAPVAAPPPIVNRPAAKPARANSLSRYYLRGL